MYVTTGSGGDEGNKQFVHVKCKYYAVNCKLILVSNNSCRATYYFVTVVLVTVTTIMWQPITHPGSSRDMMIIFLFHVDYVLMMMTTTIIAMFGMLQFIY